MPFTSETAKKRVKSPKGVIKDDVNKNASIHIPDSKKNLSKFQITFR